SAEVEGVADVEGCEAIVSVDAESGKIRRAECGDASVLERILRITAALGPGVGAEQIQASAEAALDLELHRIVIGVRFPSGVDGVPREIGQWDIVLHVSSRRQDLGYMIVAVVSGDVAGLRADVSDGSDGASRQLILEGEVVVLAVLVLHFV